MSDAEQIRASAERIAMYAEQRVRHADAAAAGLLSLAQAFVRELLEVAALVEPDDAAEAELLRGACERAQMVLDRFGDGSGH